MENNTLGKTWRRTRVVVASALVAATLIGGSAASAGDNGAFVSGNSVYSDCGVAGSDYALALVGDLEGCWSTFVEGFTCKSLEHYDLYFERGREVFVGSYHGKSGTFRTTYTFDAAYAKGFCETFDFTTEVGGGCNHKIKGRSGVFREAEGLVKFIDVITGVTGDPVTGAYTAGTGGNNFLYYGNINFEDDDQD